MTYYTYYVDDAFAWSHAEYAADAKRHDQSGCGKIHLIINCKDYLV
jgi:hypothetical protein